MGLHRLDGMVPVSRPLGYGPDHESAESPCEEHRKTHRVTEIPSSSAMVSGVGFGSLREGYEMKRGAKGDVGWPPRCKHVRAVDTGEKTRRLHTFVRAECRHDPNQRPLNRRSA